MANRFDTSVTPTETGTPSDAKAIDKDETLTPLEIIYEYEVHAYGEFIEFGCGEVKTNRKTLEALIRVNKFLKEIGVDTDDLMDLVADAAKSGDVNVFNVSETDIKRVLLNK